MTLFRDSFGSAYTLTGEERIPHAGEPYLAHMEGHDVVLRDGPGAEVPQRILAPVVKTARWEVAGEAA